MRLRGLGIALSAAFAVAPVATPILTALALFAAPTKASAQAQPPSEKLTITATSAVTWTDGETSDEVIQLEGPVVIETDRARLSAQRAVVWIKAPEDEDELPLDKPDRPETQPIDQPPAEARASARRAEIILLGDAQVEHAGGLRTGPRMAVTAEVAGEIQITAAQRDARNLSNSELYLEAFKLRETAFPTTQPSTRPEPPPRVRPGPGGVAVGAPPAEPAPPPLPPVRVIFPGEIDTSYTVDGKIAALVTGGVTLFQRLDNGDFIELQADRVVLFTNIERTGDPRDLAQLGGTKTMEAAINAAYLEGDVRIVRTPADPAEGEQRLRGKRVYYEFGTERAVLTDAVFHTVEPTMQVPVIVRAKTIRQLSAGEFTARDVQVSTSGFALPSYGIGAEKIYVRRVPTGDDRLGNRFTFGADNATFRMFGLPVMWLPSAGGSMTDRGSALRSIGLENSSRYGTGVRTRWGLFETFGQTSPEDLESTYRLDYLGDRGPAGGLEAKYEGGFITETTKQRWGFDGELDSYFVHDRGIDEFGRLPTPVIDVNPDPLVEDLRVDRPDAEFRGHALWQHQHFFPHGWQAQARLGWVSDPTYLEMYHRRHFQQRDPHDVSFYVKHQEQTEAYYFLTVLQPNNIVTTADLLQEQFEVERLPEFGYHRIGDSILGDAATLHSNNTVSALRFNRTGATPREQGFPDDFNPGPGIPSLGQTGVETDFTYRGDFRQEVDFPFSMGQFRFLPYLVGRYTGYSDSPMDGQKHRLYGGAGARVNTAFWKVDEDVRSRMFDLHRMRHVVEPEVQAYTSGTTVDRGEVFIYDEPIDGIHDVSAVQVALRQRWQTERGAPGRRRSVDVFALNVEGNFFANEPEDEIPPVNFRGLYFATLPEASIPRESLNADFTWRLSDTTVAMADLQYNLDESEWATASAGLVVRRDERLSYFASLRYIELLDSNIASVLAQYELSRKYQLTFQQSYDFGRSENVTSAIELKRRFDTFFVTFTFSYSLVDEQTGFSINIYPNWVRYGLDYGQLRDVFGPQGR